MVPHDLRGNPGSALSCQIHLEQLRPAQNMHERPQRPVIAATQVPEQQGLRKQAKGRLAPTTNRPASKAVVRHQRMASGSLEVEVPRKESWSPGGSLSVLELAVVHEIPGGASSEVRV